MIVKGKPGEFTFLLIFWCVKLFKAFVFCTYLHTYSIVLGQQGKFHTYEYVVKLSVQYCSKCTIMILLHSIHKFEKIAIGMYNVYGNVSLIVSNAKVNMFIFLLF